MIAAPLNQNGGAGETTLALHLPGASVTLGGRILVVDTDRRGPALDWSEQRGRKGRRRLFGIHGLARETLHRELPQMAQHADHVVVDGPPRVTYIASLAMPTAAVVLVPATPSPFDGWESDEMLPLLAEARTSRPKFVARFVLNRCVARTVIPRETIKALADPYPPVITFGAGRRVAFANAARKGRLVSKLDAARSVAHGIATLPDAIAGFVC